MRSSPGCDRRRHLRTVVGVPRLLLFLGSSLLVTALLIVTAATVGSDPRLGAALGVALSPLLWPWRVEHDRRMRSIL